MSWNDDIKKIIELMPKIDAIYDEIKTKKATNNNESENKEIEKLKLEIEGLNQKMKKMDALYKKRLDSALKTYTEISNNGN